MAQPRPRRLPGSFLGAHNLRKSPPRELPKVADDPDTVDRIRDAARICDEPEAPGPAILESYADVNRRIFTQQHILEVAEAQERRPTLAPQHRLDDVHRRAKNAHVDLSHEIHITQRAIDKARLRGQPVAPAAMGRLEGLEALLDGVSLRADAA